MKNTTVMKLVFVIALLVSLYLDLKWWSILVAIVAAFVLGEIYHRVTLPHRVLDNRDPGGE